MSDNAMLSVLFACGAAIIIIIAVLIARAPHVCEDSYKEMYSFSDTKECSSGAKLEISKIDGKNIVICHCPEKK